MKMIQQILIRVCAGDRTIQVINKSDVAQGTGLSLFDGIGGENISSLYFLVLKNITAYILTVFRSVIGVSGRHDDDPGVREFFL